LKFPNPESPDRDPCLRLSIGHGVHMGWVDHQLLQDTSAGSQLRAHNSGALAGVFLLGHEWPDFPRIVIFDLDMTLWPHHVERETIGPYVFSTERGGVIDARGLLLKLYPEVYRVLKLLRAAAPGLRVAFSSSVPDDLDSIVSILCLFGLYEYGDVEV